MKTRDIDDFKTAELEALKNNLDFTELEDRLEMVQAAVADEARCTIHGDDACKYP